MNTLNGGRIGIASQALGIAEASLEASIKYSKERKAFETKFANLQAIQFKLADMAMNTRSGKIIDIQSCSIKRCTQKIFREAAMAKLLRCLKLLLNVHSKQFRFTADMVMSENIWSKDISAMQRLQKFMKAHQRFRE